MHKRKPESNEWNIAVLVFDFTANTFNFEPNAARVSLYCISICAIGEEHWCRFLFVHPFPAARSHYSIFALFSSKHEQPDAFIQRECSHTMLYLYESMAGRTYSYTLFCCIGHKYIDLRFLFQLLVSFSPPIFEANKNNGKIYVRCCKCTFIAPLNFLFDELQVWTHRWTT